MRFFGDPFLTLVPTLARTSWVSWEDSTPGPLDENLGGWGIVVGDYDTDCRPDIYLINGAAGTYQNKLFKNNGGLSFDDVALSHPIGDPGHSRGGAWGDFDNDGDLDLYVAVQNGPNKLFEYVGNDEFETHVQDQSGSYGACWADYDNDGYLDIYLINNGANKLLHNDGDGTFSDSTSAAGVGDTGTGRGAAWGDYDNDRDLDLYVVNSAGPSGHGNKLFRNDGGVFEDVTAAAGVDLAAYGSQASWADYDNDGYPDLYVVNIYSGFVGNTLYHNDGDGTFTDVTSPNRLFGESAGFNATWLDYDNDGDLDVYVINADWRCRLYRNDGTAGFFVDENETTENVDIYYDDNLALQQNPKYGQSAGCADYDADGDLDLYVAGFLPTYDNVLYSNNAENDLSNNWLKITLRGTESNRCGIGARVRVAVGGQSQIREISGGTGCSQDELTVSFGLGSATAVDTLEVLWPGPHHLVDLMHNVTANQTITVIEKELYVPNCDFELAQGNPSCPFICPAGDATYNGGAPLRLEVTLRDSLNQAIIGHSDFHVTIRPSGAGIFKFCCGAEQTVLSDSTMGPSAPTNENGKAWIDIYWGGGYDQALEMRCCLDSGEQIGGMRTSLVRTPDLNADCSVDQEDIDIFIPLYFTTDWRADFNCSGQVNLSDLSYIATHYGHSCQNPVTIPFSMETLTRLREKEQDHQSLFGVDEPRVPDKFSLEQNIPNPFNPATQIRYAVPTPGAQISIDVFDVTGTRIANLVKEYKAAGNYSVTWTGKNDRGDTVPSGVYFCRLTGPGVVENRKMVLLR